MSLVSLVESINFDDSGQYNGSDDSGATGDSCDIADSILVKTVVRVNLVVSICSGQP